MDVFLLTFSLILQSITPFLLFSILEGLITPLTVLHVSFQSQPQNLSAPYLHPSSSAQTSINFLTSQISDSLSAYLTHGPTPPLGNL